MQSLARLGVALVAGSVLSGCTAYSTAVNSVGPERRISDLYEMIEYEGNTAPFCPAPEIVMVMPEEDQGVVTVTRNNGEQFVLEGDYAGIRMTEQSSETFTGDQEQLEALFGSSIAHLPPMPTYENVYFELGTTELTASSQATIREIAADLASRPVPEVIVIGHTDTTASAAFNLELSKARANLVKDELIEGGVEASKISIEGRGETELLIDTPDNVAEARNRRVVINVR